MIAFGLDERTRRRLHSVIARLPDDVRLFTTASCLFLPADLTIPMLCFPGRWSTLTIPVKGVIKGILHITAADMIDADADSVIARQIACPWFRQCGSESLGGKELDRKSAVVVREWGFDGPRANTKLAGVTKRVHVCDQSTPTAWQLSRELHGACHDARLRRTVGEVLVKLPAEVASFVLGNFRVIRTESLAFTNQDAGSVIRFSDDSGAVRWCLTVPAMASPDALTRLLPPVFARAWAWRYTPTLTAEIVERFSESLVQAWDVDDPKMAYGLSSLREK